MLGCSARTNDQFAYHVNSFSTATPDPTPAPMFPRARLGFLLPRPERLALPQPELSFAAELDRRSYSIETPIEIRFRLTDRTRRPVAFVEVSPRDIAELTLRDPDGSYEKADPSLVSPPHAVTAVPAIVLQPGVMRETAWYPLTEWGYRPVPKGAYVLSVVPSIGAANALLIDYRAERALRFASRNALQFSIR